MYRDTQIAPLRVENPAVQLLVSANPQVHDRHALPCILDRRIPELSHHPAHPFPQFHIRQHRLGLVRPQHTCPHRCARHRPRMGEKEQVGSLMQVDAEDPRQQAPQRGEMGARREDGGAG